MMFTVLVTATLLGVIFTLTTNNARLTRRTVDRSVAIAFGDAVLESLFDQWRKCDDHRDQCNRPCQRPDHGFSFRGGITERRVVVPLRYRRALVFVSEHSRANLNWSLSVAGAVLDVKRSANGLGEVTLSRTWTTLFCFAPSKFS